MKYEPLPFLIGAVFSIISIAFHFIESIPFHDSKASVCAMFALGFYALALFMIAELNK